MTRINSAIPVKSLSDEHLLAEHREIKRLPSYVVKSQKSGKINNIPNKFCLGKGHVLFFLNKQKFIFNRYKEIYNELIKREFNIENYSENWNNLKNTQLWNDYISTENERDMLIERITLRINESTKKSFHYYKRKITKEQAISFLTDIH